MLIRAFKQVARASGSVAPLIVAATFGVATSAFGGAGILTTVVTPLSPTVTYSTEATVSPARPALVTSVGYRVTIANAGGNTINNIRFTATASVTDTAEKAVFSSAEGASCTTTNPDQTSIECTIGQLTAGQGFPTFSVFFKGPVKITNAVADGENEDLVNLSGQLFYAEGTGGEPQSVPENSIRNWAAAAVTLGTFNPEEVKSALPTSGGSYFTGDGAVASAPDPFGIAVTVPAIPTSSSVALVESDVSGNINCSSLRNFVKCFRSTITIPAVDFTGTSSYLTIVLRVDVSNIKPGTKIGNVLIQYDDGVNFHNVGQCASPTTPRADGIPCIAKAVYFKNKSVPGWTLDRNGDFEWTLLNLKNGRFELF